MLKNSVLSGIKFVNNCQKPHNFMAFVISSSDLYFIRVPTITESKKRSSPPAQDALLFPFLLTSQLYVVCGIVFPSSRGTQYSQLKLTGPCSGRTCKINISISLVPVSTCAVIAEGSRGNHHSVVMFLEEPYNYIQKQVVL